MVKNQNTLAKNGRKEQFTRVALIAFVMAMFTAFAASPVMVTAFAAQIPGLAGAMNVVLDVIMQAARYIGLIVAVWGIFQAIMAFRREDSEGISKQITTVIVGAVLVGFSFVVGPLRTALGI